MKLPSIVAIGEHDNVRQTVEALASHPKVTGGVLGANAAVLAAVNEEVLTGYLSIFSLLVGGLTTAVICAYWMVRLAREWAGMRRDMREGDK